MQSMENDIARRHVTIDTSPVVPVAVQPWVPAKAREALRVRERHLAVVRRERATTAPTRWHLANAWSAEDRRRARQLAVAGLMVAAALPVILWHRLLAETFTGLRLNLAYLLSSLTPWALIAAGVALLVPVAYSTGLSPEDPLHPRARNAYRAWGPVLYLLGVCLVTQVAEIAGRG